MNRIFGPDGYLKNIVSTFEFRDEQVQMSQFILECLHDQENAIVEAGTGTGKTMGYLIPSILYAVENDKKITVSTETKALQKQLLDKDLPFVKQLAGTYLDFDFTYSLCLGSANYPCLIRIEGAINLGRFGPKELKKIISVKKRILDGSIVTRFDVPLPEYIWIEINRESDGCRSYKCPFNGSCSYQSARREWENSQVLVMNHYLFFANIAYDKAFLPRTDIAIFDEAHSLEDIAAKQIGFSLSNTQLTSILHHLYQERNRSSLVTSIADIKRRGDCIRLISEIEQDGNAYFRKLSTMLRSDQVTIRFRDPCFEQFDFSKKIKELLLIFTEIEDDFSANEFLKIDFDIARGRLFVFNENLKHFIFQNDEDYVYWIEREQKRNPGEITCKGQPVSIEEIFCREVLHYYDSSVFTSATLTVNNDISYIVNRLGIVEHRSLILSSAFDFKSQVLFFTSSNNIEPSEESFIEESVKAAESIIDICGGNCLILFTSYSMLGRVRTALEQSIEYPIFSQDRLSASEALDAFTSSTNTVLMGTHSFWQGIDLPGDLLRGLILMRLPFSVPNIPPVEARIERIAASGNNPFYQYQLPEAIIRFKQGFGRLIRSKTDKGIIAVLDPRINTKSYGKFFLNSLPECTSIQSIEELQKMHVAMMALYS